MRHKSHPNPDWTAPWNAADLKEFLRQAREHHTQAIQRKTVQHQKDLPWDSPYRIHAKPPPTSQEVLTWLYKWGRDYRVCSMDFDQFKRAVLDGSEYRWRRRRRFYYSRHDILDFRTRHHHAHVPKKELSETEIARRDWREKKGFSRDQKQRGYHRQCAAKTWAKKVSNRSERRHVRQCLHADKPILPHKWFNDPWMWD